MASRGKGGSDVPWWLWAITGAIVWKFMSSPDDGSDPQKTKALMSSMVKFCRTNPRIRKFVQGLFRSKSPLHPVAQIEKIFRFVADGIAYMKDPGGEYVASPFEVLESGVGDCDCKATLLATLLEAAGFETNFVFMPGHVYVEVGLDASFENGLPSSASFRKENGKLWIPLESTMTGGQIGWVDRKAFEAARNAGEVDVVNNWK